MNKIELMKRAEDIFQTIDKYTVAKTIFELDESRLIWHCLQIYKIKFGVGETIKLIEQMDVWSWNVGVDGVGLKKQKRLF